jgi:hypothetical protein
MEYTNNIDLWELGMTVIVFTLYIVGKVWMYYRIENPETKKQTNKKKSKVIRRGNEWD